MTDNNECDNLDAFLSEELGAGDAAKFEAHVRECAACSDAVEQQRWIDGLLRSSATLHNERAPDSVLRSFRTSLVGRRRRTALAVCGFAAAAMIIVAVGWTALRNRPPISPADSEIATEMVSDRTQREIRPPRATFVGGPDMIVVPVESPHPEVTVVRVYPTYEPAYAAQARTVQPAQDEFDWPFESNGG